MTLRRVGILGGMGPEATVLLMRKVIAAVPAEDDGAHVPLIVDQNPQVPSRIRHLIYGTGADPGPVLADMAHRLETAGAQALAMPCNTAHHYTAHIRNAARIPFLDMVALAADHAAELSRTSGADRIGILASPALRRIGLYEAPLAERGLIPVYPTDENALLAAIRSVKSRGPNQDARDTLATAARELGDAGAGMLAVACTEFSLITDAAEVGAEVFDTLDVLVGHIVGFARAEGADSRTAAQ
jgi:aspartate racemase